MTHPSPVQPPSLRQQLMVHGAYLMVLVLLFGDLAFADVAQVLGSQSGDLFQQFLPWRSWGFEQLAQGHLPLWNPRVYSGAPFIGGFQSALFYPPNWIFLVSPLSWAVNASIWFHMLLMAGLMFHWALSKGMDCAPAAFSGLIAMLGGAFFLHVYAGHLTNICAMAWMPLILRSVETMVNPPAGQTVADSLRWSLLGALATSMQILAGHPQYVYYTAIAVGLYLLLNLSELRRPPRKLALLALMPFLAVALAALQLLPSWQATAETIRAQPLTFSFASNFSFPIENSLTVLMPHLFGSESTGRYFGRGFLWESCVYFGVAGLFLAVYGATSPRLVRLDRWQYPVMIALLFLLALGAQTPLYALLYDVLPGYSKFRGTTKFVVLCQLYLALLAGWGMQRLTSGEVLHAWIPAAVGALGLFLLLAALGINANQTQPFLQWLSLSENAYALVGPFNTDTPPHELQRFVLAATNVMRYAMSIGAVSLLLLSLGLYLSRRKPGLVWCVAAMAVLELLLFARAGVTSFPVQDPTVPALRNFLHSKPGDYRSANVYLPYYAMLYDGFDVDGSDPSITLRYAQLMHFLQGNSPDEASQFLDFASRWRPAYDMLRLAYVIRLNKNGGIDIAPVGRPLPTALLVDSARVLPDRDSMFAAIADDQFDPRTTVLLEQAPDVIPQAGVKGSVQILRNASDDMELLVELDRPGLLLLTDIYTPSWKVQALESGAQTSYQLLPANYVLRAVPLQAGRHHLKVYYERGWLHAGMAISAIAMLVWLLLWRRTRRA